MAKYLMNFTQYNVLKVQNLKEHSRNWTYFHPEWGKASF